MAPLYSKFALCFLIMTLADAGVLKSRQISLPSGPIVMDVAIRQKSNDTAAKTIATMKIEIDGEDKKVTLFDAAAEMPPDKVIEMENNPKFVPSIEDRSIFSGTKCPKGYVKRDNVCFPEDYD
ncbi:uncharacterized protein LOC125232613 [Leguminivora glycinivorella]|uniref:uncharacterized protein LOC125232613 n=1 Tax=Leguminivora glycinivorella TaxID=1035111 RepID=UPI00200E4D53|nr:uncharacterized protein LOC125232613 [Leguminivora glycinivorella]